MTSRVPLRQIDSNTTKSFFSNVQPLQIFDDNPTSQKPPAYSKKLPSFQKPLTISRADSHDIRSTERVLLGSLKLQNSLLRRHQVQNALLRWRLACLHQRFTVDADPYSSSGLSSKSITTPKKRRIAADGKSPGPTHILFGSPEPSVSTSQKNSSLLTPDRGLKISECSEYDQETPSQLRRMSKVPAEKKTTFSPTLQNKSKSSTTTSPDSVVGLEERLQSLEESIRCLSLNVSSKSDSTVREHLTTSSSAPSAQLSPDRHSIKSRRQFHMEPTGTHSRSTWGSSQDVSHASEVPEQRRSGQVNKDREPLNQSGFEGRGDDQLSSAHLLRERKQEKGINTSHNHSKNDGDIQSRSQSTKYHTYSPSSLLHQDHNISQPHSNQDGERGESTSTDQAAKSPNKIATALPLQLHFQALHEVVAEATAASRNHLLRRHAPPQPTISPPPSSSSSSSMGSRPSCTIGDTQFKSLTGRVDTQTGEWWAIGPAQPSQLGDQGGGVPKVALTDLSILQSKLSVWKSRYAKPAVMCTSDGGGGSGTHSRSSAACTTSISSAGTNSTGSAGTYSRSSTGDTNSTCGDGANSTSR